MHKHFAFRGMHYAFAQGMHTEVLGLLNAWKISVPEHQPRWTFQVKVDNEALEIPVRLYLRHNEWTSWIGDDDTTQRYKMISWCLGTRDSDGFYRESCVRKLLACPEPWIVPFVIAPVGEYVLEIVQAIQAALPTLDRKQYGQFVQANPAYMATLHQRIVSYWNCYYRRQFDDFKAYPAAIVFNELQAMSQEVSYNYEE
jgi:hypothetical protein